MAIWAIADLHLSFGLPDKKMDIFGEQWINHPLTIATHWKEQIQPEDLVLIAGDISWALHADDVKKDLEWIGALPGTKLFIKGNHDYWWQSLSKVKRLLPPSCFVIQNDAFYWNGVAIAGTRLWDCPEFNFNGYIDVSASKEHPPISAEDRRIFDRELHRLELSLQAMNKEAALKIVMTHYPPIGGDLKPCTVSSLLEKHGIQIAIFGHLHNVKKGASLFGTARGIEYRLTACDYLDFRPLRLA